MNRYCQCWAAVAFVILAPRARAGDEALALFAAQKDYITHEPLLVTLRVGDAKFSLPAAEKNDAASLRFEIAPSLKPRPSVKPLAVEARVDGKASVASRRYDLLEWFHFPAEGSFTVSAVLKTNGVVLKSAPISFTITRPAKGDKEWGPVDRLHHLPWCSYVTDAFCGDTFDLVKQWPESRLAPYAHYWNGLHLAHKKEHAKAVDSFKTLLARHPGSILVPAARIGLAEALAVTGNYSDAHAALEPVFHKTKSEPALLVTYSERLAAEALLATFEKK